MIEIKLITARSVTVEVHQEDAYYSGESIDLYLNEDFVMRTNRVNVSLFNLKPNTIYTLQVKRCNELIESTQFKTKGEYVTLNVKDFGAKGDGYQDDTHYIQAAILACPKNSRVLVPKGRYLVRQLFLTSNIQIEIAKDAIILGNTNREDLAIFRGEIESYDKNEYYNLGTWEGNPLDMYAGIITMINVENVVLYGEGTIDGQSSDKNWWRNPKEQPQNIFRPRLLFVSNSCDVTVQGLTFRNSPSWNIHPYFSKRIALYSISIQSEKDSPNTDGIDIESCSGVTVEGCHFNLGDDCIAIKSGKIYMAKKYNVPSKNITIRHCLMENGHGAVTLGSELAGGVYDVKVDSCLFIKTDRGLRIKTRRGRGELAKIDNIYFNKIKMQDVLTPFVTNSFYFCDPDGKSDYVQCETKLDVDNRTPSIGSLYFKNIICNNAHVAAGYFAGLPERKIKLIYMENVDVHFAKAAIMGVPAMRCNIEQMTKGGFNFLHVNEIELKNVNITGNKEDDFIYNDVKDVKTYE